MDMEFKHLAAVLNEYGQAVKTLYADNLRGSKRPTTENTLINEMRYIVVSRDRTWEVMLSLKDYWKYIEYGTSPHWPPVDAIRHWVEVKPVVPYPMSNGKVPTVNQLAFLVSRKIAQVGTEGKDDLGRALQAINAQYTERIEQAITEDISESVDFVLEEFYNR